MEFKVGDKVRILDGTKQEGWAFSGSMKETIGMVGKIICIDIYDPKYRVMFEEYWWDYNEEDLEKVATLIDVPYEIKDLIKPLGIEWNNRVKTWFMLKGFDVESVNNLKQTI